VTERHENDRADEEQAREAPHEPFLARWSRLKRGARAGAAGSPPLDSSTEPPARELEAPPGDEDMPPLESLSEDSDYSAFLSPRVSDDLRRAALRKLFHSPKYNVCDGLDDYWGDRRTYTPLGDIVTADMRRALERAVAQTRTLMAAPCASDASKAPDGEADQAAAPEDDPLPPAPRAREADDIG
jgi:Protein of unknown function (DUF3306)